MIVRLLKRINIILNIIEIAHTMTAEVRIEMKACGRTVEVEAGPVARSRAPREGEGRCSLSLMTSSCTEG